MRKLNKILSCERTGEGNLSIFVLTPKNRVRRRLYIGCPKAEALKKARHTDFDHENTQRHDLAR